MNKVFTAKVLAMALALHLTASVPAAFAAPSADDLKNQMSALDGDIASTKQELLKSGQTLRAAEIRLGAVSDNLESLESKRSAYIKDFEKDRKTLTELVMALERIARVPQEALLTRPSKPIDTARSAMLLKHSFPQIEKRTLDLKKKLEEIEAVENEISSNAASQSAAREKLKLRQSQLSGLLAKQEALYKATAAERAAQEAEARALAKKSISLADLIGRLRPRPSPAEVPQKSAPADARLKNTLLPAYGKIKTGFGQTNDLGADSQGITISAAPGAAVVAPMGGKVKFAGAFQKFKHILIIEHPGGYHSLIAGLSRIDTVVGASVSAGEPVGVLGDDTPAPQLYYEVRKDGKPVDPKPILAAYNKQRKQRL